ncbi:hypothetical protein [Streptomyces sp. NPDC051636]|uniref:hypothetical protein n=1 Tax=Streptomyces sp. NPDC051636 TaxID=3365663 RepID=UPI0037B215D9
MTHNYAVNARIEFQPQDGTRNGHTDTALSPIEKQLRGALAAHVAQESGCHPDDVTFVEFRFTEIPIA